MTPTGLSRSAIEAAGRKILRLGGKQVLLIAHAGQIFAVANRCPHEGFPLSEGTLGPGCVITCNWHNWKFDLLSGEALVGRDPVRRYAVSEQDGELCLDLSDPPAGAQRTRALHGLSAALADYDRPRLARETVRLMRAGFDAHLALTHAIASTAARFEDGMTHAHAAAADWLRLAQEAPDETRRLSATLEPLGHIAWDMRGAGEFPYADGARSFDAGAFVQAVEDEREADAVAIVRGAAEMDYAILRPSLAKAALAHYADFGHSVIYTLKTGELIAQLGSEAAGPLLLLLTRALVRATREDRLPEFRGYAPALAAWDDGGGAPIATADLTGLNNRAMLARLLASAKRPVREIYDALMGAAAHNLLHFDTAVEHATDNAIADNVGWLDFTHALTFANAARQLCEETPALWPAALLQLGLFVSRNAGYLAGEAEVTRWHVPSREAFLRGQMAALYDSTLPEPIIACHRLKMLFALRSELAVSPDAPWAGAMCAAVNRFLSTPVKRQHALRLAAQALDFIAKEA